MLWFVAMRALALDPSLPPGANFDLSHWYLTQPDATATTVKGPQLTAGYTNASWFYTGPDGAMTMWCPVSGGRTSGSSYPRSELRETLDPAKSSVNWTAYGTHVLDAQCVIRQVPSTERLVIGQIHSYLGSAHELIVLKYISGSMEAQVRNGPESSAKTYLQLGTVDLNQLITYQIKLVNGLLTLTLNGVTQSVDILQLDPAWGTQTFYFKAGSYCQDNSGPDTEGSLVAFYELRVHHGEAVTPPSITTQPANRRVNADPPSAVSFQVAAKGTPPLFYQWLKDGTVIANATNSVLTIATVATNDTGAYRVVITNNYGAITSAVATLTVVTPAAGSSLGEALDTSLIWVTGGTPAWFAQTTVSHDGVDAAQSGPIGNSKSNSIQTTVTGPGTIKFWWKVSSQGSGDYLRFHIGSKEKSKISGEKDWEMKSFTVLSGTQVLKWTYSKNSSKTAGQDRAWLDEVQFTPSPLAALQLTEPARTVPVMISISGSWARISWPTAPGKSYELQSKTRITDQDWNPLPLETTTEGSVEVAEDEISGAQRFYRVIER